MRSLLAGVCAWCGVCLLAVGMLIYVPASRPNDPLTRLHQAALAVPQALAGSVDVTKHPSLPMTQARLDLAASRLGAYVTNVPLAPGYFGRTWREHRQIEINDASTPGTKAATLAHELAHLLQPLTLNKGEEEVWAESIAYLVTREEGDDQEELTLAARYISRYKQNLDVLDVYRTELLFAATMLKGES